MGRGFKNGGGGSLLNFKVVGNPKPDAPRENTIWIDTDTPINGYTLSADAPANPVEGMAWIFTETASTVPFSATKKNPIMVYPHASYQYTGGAWVQKAAQIYMDGAWQDWYTYLFNNGSVNDVLTGGINGTIQNGKIHFSASVDASDNKTYTTRNKINLTNVNTVKYVVTSTATNREIYFRALATNTLRNGANVTTSNVAAYRAHYSPFVDSIVEVSLDVSSLSGEYYLGYAWGVNSDGTKQTIVGDIERWWLE